MYIVCLMIVGRCSSCFVSCVLFVVCVLVIVVGCALLLVGVCCLWFVVYGVSFACLFGVRCLVVVVCWLLCDVSRCPLFVVWRSLFPFRLTVCFRRSLFVVWCLMFVVFCVLVYVPCLMAAACCLLLFAGLVCLLFVVCGSLFGVRRWFLFVVACC